MVLKSTTVNQDIVKEDYDETAKTRGQCSVHGTQECAQSTNQSKHHDIELILPQMRLKCRLVGLTRLH